MADKNKSSAGDIAYQVLAIVLIPVTWLYQKITGGR